MIKKSKNNVMNENNHIIDEAYEHYRNHFLGYDDVPTKDVFVFECKTNKSFSEKWGLKIVERELDMFERWKLADLTPNMMEIDWCNKLCDEHNVPTKLITITYNNKTIESYE